MRLYLESDLHYRQFLHLVLAVVGAVEPLLILFFNNIYIRANPALWRYDVVSASIRVRCIYANLGSSILSCSAKANKTISFDLRSFLIAAKNAAGISAAVISTK